MEALLWLISPGGEGNRAFMAAGCAAAAAAKGVRVTLIEVGGGLPNIGYYFGLDPPEYAAAGPDHSRLLVGDHGPNLRYISCTRTGSLDRLNRDSSTVDSPHLLLVAFDGPGDYRAMEDIGGRWLPEHGGLPDALCLYGGSEARREQGVSLAEVMRRNRDAYILNLAMEAGGAEGFEADESIPVPDRLVSSWRRKSPPEDPFFDDVVSTLLQVLSHRRRRTEDHAAG